MRLAAGARRGRTSMRPFLPGWYVSPSGTSGGNGSPSSPWSLKHAASGANGQIQPGDTVWMRGGTYNDGTFAADQGGIMFNITVDGTAGNPITFRSYPGEWAVLSDHRLIVSLPDPDPGIALVQLSGDYLVLRDCELVCTVGAGRETVTNRGAMGGGLEMRSLGGQVVNIVVHDVFQLGFWQQAKDSEMVGLVSYNYSVCNDTSTQRGHGAYTQMYPPDTMTFRDCHWLGGYGYNVHVYGTQAPFGAFLFDGCSSLDGNILNYGFVENPSPGGFDLWGGSTSGKPITQATWDKWFSDALGHRVDEPTPTDFPDTLRIRNSVLAPKATTTNPRVLQWNGVTNIKEVKNNIFIKGGDRVTSDAGFPVVDYGFSDADGRTGSFTPAATSDIDANLYYGFDISQRAISNLNRTGRTLAQWQAETGYDLNSQYVNMRNNPANYPEPVVSIVANPREQGRATIRMYKRADDAAHTFLDSSSGLAAPLGVSLDDVLNDGETYYLYDARNPLAGAFQTGTYRAGLGINVTFGDMPGRATPNGWTTTPSGNQATHPVIIVRKVGPTWVAPPLTLAVA